MRRRSSRSTIAVAAAVGMALLLGLLLLHGQVHTTPLLPGAEAFLLPSRGIGGSSRMSSSGRIVTATAARTAATTPSTTRLYHTPDASAAPATAAGVRVCVGGGIGVQRFCAWMPGANVSVQRPH